MLQFGRKTVEKEVTEEERVSKAQKRREIETEKREKMKQKTMDMLLKKKDSKATKQIKTAKSSTKEDSPIISYINNGAGISLSYPPGTTYPLTKTVAAPPRPGVRNKFLCFEVINKNICMSSVELLHVQQRQEVPQLQDRVPAVQQPRLLQGGPRQGAECRGVLRWFKCSQSVSIILLGNPSPAKCRIIIMSLHIVISLYVADTEVKDHGVFILH